MILVIFMTALIVAYVVAFCIRHGGVPDSLVSSVFYMPKPCIYAWSAVLAAIALSLTPIFLYTVSEASLALVFLTGGSLLFMSWVSLDKDKTEFSYKAYCSGAAVSGASSQVLIALNEPALVFCWVPWILYYSIGEIMEVKWKKAVFVAEMTCILDVLIYCYMHCLAY